MKKIITALTLATSLSAFAAVDGQLTISGVVAPELSIALSASTYSSLSITSGGDHTVAVATEVSNDLDGYKVFGYSSNGSQLENQSNTAIKTAYTVKYDGASGETLGNSVATRVELKDSGAQTTAVTDTSNVVVDVTAFSNAPAGTYQDTITLQIEAN